MLENNYVIILKTEEELRKFLVEKLVEGDLQEFLPECSDEYMQSGVVGYYRRINKVVLWNFNAEASKHGSKDEL